MRAIFESIFDVVYLLTVIVLGIKMIRDANGRKQYFLFGVMAVVLGFGDAFHLVPRIMALLTTGFDDYTIALGMGKLITSITMTIFYVILYYVWRLRYKVVGKRSLTLAIYALAIIRIVLCLCPENKFLSSNPPISWAIYRNIPFLIMGVIIMVIFYNSQKEYNDTSFKYLWLTIVLSFAFYAPVVLYSQAYPAVGSLMIPKTCAYVWTVLIGYYDMKGVNNEKKIS